LLVLIYFQFHLFIQYCYQSTVCFSRNPSTAFILMKHYWTTLTYVQFYIMAGSHNHCFHGNATILSPSIVVSIHVSQQYSCVSNAMVMQQWVPFALLSTYKTFHAVWVWVSILAWVIWHANHVFSALYNIISSSLSGSIIFFSIISEVAQFSEKIDLMQNVGIDFLYNFCLQHCSV
jgi:tellurite resistance-related uncharacterized protein